MEPFGPRLKQEREARGMTLDQISAATKIGTRFLRALEEEHFDQLPGGIFNKGFIRAYARCLGLNEDQLIASYLALTEETQPVTEESTPKQSLPALTPDDLNPKLPLGIIAVLAIAFLVALAAREIYFHRAAIDSVAQIKQANPEQQNSKSLHQGVEKQLSGKIPSSAAESKIVQPAGSRSLAAGSFVVRIEAHDECWVLIQADGKEPLDEILDVGGEETVQAASKIVIKAGNIGGVDFFFNGSKLPSQGEEEEVKTLTFDANGLESQTGH